jgi:hypothetical protein
MLYMICKVIMRQTIINQDISYAHNRRLIKRLWKRDKTEEFPLGLEFAFQILYFNDVTWIHVARIDNQLRGGRPGTHMHLGKKIIWEELSFEAAEKKIITLAEHAIARRRTL